MWYGNLAAVPIFMVYYNQLSAQLLYERAAHSRAAVPTDSMPAASTLRAIADVQVTAGIGAGLEPAHLWARVWSQATSPVRDDHEDFDGAVLFRVGS